MLGASKSHITIALNSTVNTSGHPYPFLKSEYKDTQKQFTENLWAWKDEHPLTNRNFFFNLKQFDHCSKLLKRLKFKNIKGSFFVFYTVIPGYFNEFIYEIMKLNISKIKHHSNEVLNQQVYLEIFWRFFAKKRWFLLQGCHFFYFYPL